MTKAHAYLARIKDQEKDVIAVPDGAGRALCVSSDKHWTLTREWDELYIIASLVEEAEPADPAVFVVRESDIAAVEVKRNAEGDCFSDRVWKRAYESMRRERDAAVRRAKQAETEFEKAKNSTLSQLDWAGFLCGEEYQDLVARAEKAERERDEDAHMVDGWKHLCAHPVLRTDVLPDGATYADKMFKRITWLFETAEDARESNPAPAVSRADIEKVVAEWVDDAPEIVNEVWALVSGADPAVYVIRESDLPTVQQDEDGEWYPGDRWDLADDRFIDVEGALEKMHLYAAIARAIEAKQDVDPIEEKARELYRAATPDARWETVADEYRRIAAHVLGQEADDA